MRTSVPGVFVAGEATGIGGADLALVEGELAGHAAARARARRRDLAALRAPPREAGRLRADPLGPVRPAARACSASPTPDTVLCRCEDVTAGAIDAAVAGGATTMSALKIVTRCGQGPCQGRVCERLVCERLPEPERFSARAPIRPIPLDVLMDSSSTA